MGIMRWGLRWKGWGGGLGAMWWIGQQDWHPVLASSHSARAVSDGREE
jgi:hypothetical protein